MVKLPALEVVKNGVVTEGFKEGFTSRDEFRLNYSESLGGGKNSEAYFFPGIVGV